MSVHQAAAMRPFQILNATCSYSRWPMSTLKDNSTMYKTEAQIVSYDILY